MEPTSSGKNDDIDELDGWKATWLASNPDDPEPMTEIETFMSFLGDIFGRK
jgi:hypothetical protein